MDDPEDHRSRPRYNLIDVSFASHPLLATFQTSADLQQSPTDSRSPSPSKTEELNESSSETPTKPQQPTESPSQIPTKPQQPTESPSQIPTKTERLTEECRGTASINSQEARDTQSQGESKATDFFIQDDHLLLSEQLRLRLALETTLPFSPNVQKLLSLLEERGMTLDDARDVAMGDFLKVWRDRSLRLDTNSFESLNSEAQFNSVFLNSHSKSQHAWRYRQYLMTHLCRCQMGNGDSVANLWERGGVARFDPVGQRCQDLVKPLPIRHAGFDALFIHPAERFFLNGQFALKKFHYFAAKYCHWLLFSLLPKQLHLYPNAEAEEVLKVWLSFLEPLAFQHSSYQYLTLMTLRFCRWIITQEDFGKETRDFAERVGESLVNVRATFGVDNEEATYFLREALKKGSLGRLSEDR